MITIVQTDILNLISFWKSLCFDSNVTEISSNGPSDNTLGLDQLMDCRLFTDNYIDGSVQDCSNFIANTLSHRYASLALDELLIMFVQCNVSILTT